nr:hypothetical protein [Tanacetum cinerariifolium]
NARDYATLVAHPSPFQKFPEEFMCLVGLSRHYTLDVKTYPRFLHKNGEGMDLFAFIHTQNPTKRKRKTIVVEVGGSSHPPNKLRDDHETPSGPPMAGKSRSAVQRLLVGAVLNIKVSGDPILTLAFVTSSVSVTPERKNGDHTDSVTEPNLRTISAPQSGIRTVISPDTDLQKVMEHKQLFTEFDVGAAQQMSLSDEVRDREIEKLKAQLLLKDAEAAVAICLRVEASKLEAVKKSLENEVKALKGRNVTL